MLWWYIGSGVFGASISLLIPKEQILIVLEILSPVTITALFASLMLAHAAFSRKERWQSKSLLVVPPMLLVATLTLVGRLTSGWGQFAAVGLGLGVCLSHFGFWLSSPHSRAYRFEQFKTGFAPMMPKTAMLVATLDGAHCSDVGDMIVSAVLSASVLFPGDIVPSVREACPIVSEAFVREVLREMERVRQLLSGASTEDAIA